MDGLEEMYRGEAGVVSTLLNAVPEYMHPRVGIADAKFPAFVAARTSRAFGASRVPDDVRAFLALHPVELLPVSANVKIGLRRFGLHYHCPERSQLQDALVAARLNTTIDQALPHLRPNHHLYLKSQAEMEALFEELPEAVSNTVRIAEQCAFDLGTALVLRLLIDAKEYGSHGQSNWR